MIHGTKVVVDMSDTFHQQAYGDDVEAIKDTFARCFCEGAFLVYSVTSRSSFEHIAAIRERVLRIRDGRETPMVLVGNKADLESERVVSTAEGEELARALNLLFREMTVTSHVMAVLALSDLVAAIFNDRADKNGANKSKCVIV